MRMKYIHFIEVRMLHIKFLSLLVWLASNQPGRYPPSHFYLLLGFGQHLFSKVVFLFLRLQQYANQDILIR